MSTHTTPTTHETSLETILSDDDAVDALDAAAVMDVYVRQQLMHAIEREASAAYRRSERFDDDVDLVKTASLKAVAIQTTPTDHELRDMTSWNSDNPKRVFAWLTGHTRDEIEAADVDLDEYRSRLKNTLRGCGMPDVEVVRERVDYHTQDTQ